MELLWFAHDREADQTLAGAEISDFTVTAKDDLPRWLTSAEVWPALLHSIYQGSSYK